MKGRIAACLALSFAACAVAEADVFGVFVGSTPPDRELLESVGLTADSRIEHVRWELTLHRDPVRYELRYDAGNGLTGKREGVWNVRRGIKSDPMAISYDLRGAFALAQIDVNLLQVLAEDRSYRVGDGGYSYTLNRAEHAESPPAAKLASEQPDMTYPISAESSGPGVYGVFEGRTPCLGVARQLNVQVARGCSKAKWRLTLYRDPATRLPTRYKLEGSLFQRGAREGNWKILRGLGEDSDVFVYRLDGTATDPELLLMKGDENVLFMLNEDRDPRVGHAEHSYTLNRATPRAPGS